MNKFEKYYRENLVILPPRSKFRQFKLILGNGDCVKLRDDIRDGNTLRRHLIRWNPVNVYYSVSKFLRPQKVKMKVKNMTWDQKKHYYHKKPMKHGTVHTKMFLSGDLALEIDEKDEKNARKALEILKNIGMKNFYFVDSNRGIHFHCFDFWDVMCPKAHKILMPGDRENYCFMKKKYVADILKLKGVNFDYSTTIDTRRVIGLYFSMHKKGTIRFGSTDLEKVMGKWR